MCKYLIQYPRSKVSTPLAVVKLSNNIIYMSTIEEFEKFLNTLLLLQLSPPIFKFISSYILRACDEFPKWYSCSILTYIFNKQLRLRWPCSWYVLQLFVLILNSSDVEVQLRLRVIFAFEHVVESILLHTTTLSFWSFILLRWRSKWHQLLESRTKQPNYKYNQIINIFLKNFSNASSGLNSKNMDSDHSLISKCGWTP